MRRLLTAAAMLVLTVVIGCGSGAFTDYPNRLTGADGQEFFLEDLEAIANHPTLTADEKRQRFRDLGIEDETLIDALLGL